jgi:hypothetical protein
MAAREMGQTLVTICFYYVFYDAIHYMMADAVNTATPRATGLRNGSKT